MGHRPCDRDRTGGPILLNNRGTRMDRHAAMPQDTAGIADDRKSKAIPSAFRLTASSS